MHTARMANDHTARTRPEDRLRQAREMASYKTASDAARAMGVPIPTYTQHENGTRDFIDSAARYAAFFRVSLDWLLTGRGVPRGPSEVQQLYDRVPPHRQREALRYLEYLANLPDQPEDNRDLPRKAARADRGR